MPNRLWEAEDSGNDRPLVRQTPRLLRHAMDVVETTEVITITMKEVAAPGTHDPVSGQGTV